MHTLGHCRRLLSSAAAIPCQRAVPAALERFALSPVPSDFPVGDVAVFADFVTEEEERECVASVDRALSKKQYESNHMDHVIARYREFMRSIASFPSEKVRAVLERAVATAEHWDAITSRAATSHSSSPSTPASQLEIGRPPEPIKWQGVHVLDLAEDGEIGHHVDHLMASDRCVEWLLFLPVDKKATNSWSFHDDHFQTFLIQYSGRIIAGLCLLSPCVMRFKRHASDAASTPASTKVAPDVSHPIKAPGTEDDAVAIHLPRRCFYIQRFAPFTIPQPGFRSRPLTFYHSILNE
jgi:hypothetical protein